MVSVKYAIEQSSYEDIKIWNKLMIPVKFLFVLLKRIDPLLKYLVHLVIQSITSTFFSKEKLKFIIPLEE